MVRVIWVVLALLMIPAAAGAADLVRDRIYPAPQTPLSLDGLIDSARLESVRTDDGLTLQGVMVEGRSDRPVLLVFHGNASSASGVATWLRPVLDQGYGLVAAEYRGYSANPGTPSEDGLARDADAWMARTRLMAGDRPVWIVGHSLGGGVAMGLETRTDADLIVTIGTFTRLRDMVSGMARAVVPDAYRNLDRARTVRIPWFIVHGTADDTVPSRQGEQLHGAASEAQRNGASLVILNDGHRPEGETIARILEAIRQRAADGPPSPTLLPSEVKVVPFGQSRPLPAS